MAKNWNLKIDKWEEWRKQIIIRINEKIKIKFNQH